MKRYLSIITTLFLLFTSAGCGADKDETKAKGSKAQCKDKVEKMDVSNINGKGIHHTNHKTEFHDSENADVIKSQNEHKMGAAAYAAFSLIIKISIFPTKMRFK